MPLNCTTRETVETEKIHRSNMYSSRDSKGQIVRLRDLDGQGPDKVTREGHASGWYSIDFVEPRNYRNKTKIIDLAFIVPDIYVFNYF